MSITINIDFRSFTTQLRFFIIACGILSTIIGGFAVWEQTHFSFGINPTCLGLSTLMSFLHVFNIIERREALRKIEIIYHVVGGMLLIIGASIGLSVEGRFSGEATFLACAALVGLTTGLVYFLMAWALLRGLSNNTSSDVEKATYSYRPLRVDLHFHLSWNSEESVDGIQESPLKT